MHPKVEIVVDGAPVAGGFYERLVSVSVTDKEGFASDTFQMDLNDGPPSFLAIPRKGAIVDIRIGYGGARSLGLFVVDKVKVNCLPYSMSISGKARDMRSGKMKEKQERHWDRKKVKDIVGDVAADSGLSASVDEEIGDHEYEWFGQQDESNVHVLRRLAERHNALFKVRDGRLVFSKRGSGNAASGRFLGSVVVHPGVIIQGSCSFEANDRTKYKKVVSYHQDKGRAERVEIEADADADGDSVYRIPEPFADVAEADKAAQAKAKELKRGEGAASVTVVGDTAIVAGAPLMFEGVRPGFDGVPFIIDTATHTYRKSEGYRTQISAKLYDGSSAKKKSDGAGGDGAAGETGSAVSKDNVAKDAPAGTPATPAEWASTRRYGRTDEN
ncbi:phage late control D family protein [Shinella sp. NM-101]|uniref:phage late control D family protein n=1 Tax=Shinella sp. NM-101 TaxID=2744455 RepID=UPI001F19A03A|nr:contractile injection system protein, VgrG/Pvc8 family [Shinella sp. NM-101]